MIYLSGIIYKILFFKPYQREAFLHNDKILFNDDSQDLGMPPNPISNFYSSDEFTDLTRSKRLSSDNLSFLHLNIRSIRNKFDVLINYLNSLTHKFYQIITYIRVTMRCARTAAGQCTKRLP